MRLVLNIMLLLLAALAWPAPAPGAGSQVIAKVRADLDGDGAAETLEVVMLSGRRELDAEPWCGAGDMWRGRFELRVRRGGRVLDRRAFGPLFWPPDGQGEEITFWAPLRIVLADYNGDGRPDFNLGQYGSCNGNLYRLYTLGPAGRLAELPLAGGGAVLVSGAGRSNSTRAIAARGGVISASHYDNLLGRVVTRRWRWDGKRFQPLE